MSKKTAGGWTKKKHTPEERRELRAIDDGYISDPKTKPKAKKNNLAATPKTTTQIGNKQPTLFDKNTERKTMTATRYAK